LEEGVCTRIAFHGRGKFLSHVVVNQEREDAKSCSKMRNTLVFVQKKWCLLGEIERSREDT